MSMCSCFCFPARMTICEALEVDIQRIISHPHPLSLLSPLCLSPSQSRSLALSLPLSGLSLSLSLSLSFFARVQ